jgi:hypothetical protein
MSDEALRRLVREIDSRPMPARLRHEDAERLAQRFRSIPPPSLRRRILVG